MRSRPAQSFPLHRRLLRSIFWCHLLTCTASLSLDWNGIGALIMKSPQSAWLPKILFVFIGFHLQVICLYSASAFNQSYINIIFMIRLTIISLFYSYIGYRQLCTSYPPRQSSSSFFPFFLLCCCYFIRKATYP